MFTRRVVWAVFISLVLCANADARLLILVSSESPLYRSFEQGLKTGLATGKEQQKIIFKLADTFEATKELSSYSMIIAAGVDAAKRLVGHDIGDIKVIYTMLPLNSYEWLHENNQLVKNHQVLYIDQPPYRFINLVKTALPGVKSLGYVYGDVSLAHVDKLEQAAKSQQLSFNAVALQPERNLAATLDTVVSQNDALLVLPDPYLFNRRAVQALLLASLRQRKPLIAYSDSYVNAGALLALFSSPEQIGRYTAELVNCFEADCKDIAARQHHPKYFSVSVNKVVARQLGITIPSAKEIEAQLEAMEP